MLINTPLTDLSSQNQFERFNHAIFDCAAANVQEVGRLTAFEFDDVHSGHRQTGTVNHTADVAFQGNIVQVESEAFSSRSFS